MASGNITVDITADDKVMKAITDRFDALEERIKNLESVNVKAPKVELSDKLLENLGFRHRICNDVDCEMYGVRLMRLHEKCPNCGEVGLSEFGGAE